MTSLSKPGDPEAGVRASQTTRSPATCAEPRSWGEAYTSVVPEHVVARASGPFGRSEGPRKRSRAMATAPTAATAIHAGRGVMLQLLARQLVHTLRIPDHDRGRCRRASGLRARAAEEAQPEGEVRAVAGVAADLLRRGVQQGVRVLPAEHVAARVPVGEARDARCVLAADGGPAHGDAVEVPCVRADGRHGVAEAGAAARGQRGAVVRLPPPVPRRGRGELR